MLPVADAGCLGVCIGYDLWFQEITRNLAWMGAEVLLCPVEDRPGAGGAIMRRIADAGVNVDFIYLSVKGQLVVGAGDIDKARAAVMET